MSRKTYMAVVSGNALQKSKNKGTPSVKIKCTTLHDVLNPSIPVQKVLYGDIWLTFACLEKSTDTLRKVFGWEGRLISEFSEPILVGKKIEIVCEEEEWEGEVREKIMFFNKPGGLNSVAGEELNTLVDDVQPMLDEHFKSIGLDIPSGSMQEDSVPDPDSVSNPVSEHDLPF